MTSTRLSPATHSPGILGADPGQHLAKGTRLSSEAGGRNESGKQAAFAAAAEESRHPASPLKDRGTQSPSFFIVRIGNHTILIVNYE